MKLYLSIAFFIITSTLFAKDLDIPTNSGISYGFHQNGVRNWDDIPYAQPPVGDLRWMAPRKIIKNNI